MIYVAGIALAIVSTNLIPNLYGVTALLAIVVMYWTHRIVDEVWEAFKSGSTLFILNGSQYGGQAALMVLLRVSPVWVVMHSLISIATNRPLSLWSIGWVLILTVTAVTIYGCVVGVVLGLWREIRFLWNKWQER